MARSALEEETRVLEILQSTWTLLGSNLELEGLVQAVTDAGRAACGARFGAFFYNETDAGGDVYRLHTLSGAPRAAFENLGNPRATPFFAPTFRGEGVIRLDDVKADPRYGQWGPHHDSLRVISPSGATSPFPSSSAPARSWAASAEAKSIVLRTAIDPKAGAVMGDPDRLQQIAWNLLANAVKFTPRGGKVDVVLQLAGSSVELVVRDNGVGISPEFLPHVFERFTQADASSTRRHGGLGFGLSIVKHLVELHGGTIHAHSREGGGATFTVTLPLRAVEVAGRAHPRRHVASDPSLDVSLQGLRVLVVDDEADARELLRTVLGDAAAEVDVAASGHEALRLLALHVPDVIVSDIGMPGKDGYQLMREIRGLPHDAGGRTPAIALTAFARSQDRTRAMIAGYQVHVTKPIEPQELVAAIRSLADHRG